MSAPISAVLRRERAVARTREDILEAAARAFAAAGFQAATMRDIAREAGYTPPALYTYFESKQEILRALVDLVMDEFLRVFDEPPAESAGFVERLETVLRRQIEVLQRRSSVLALLITLPPGELCAIHGNDRAEHPMERQIRRLSDWLRANATAADLGGHEPDEAARVIESIAFAFVHRLPFEPLAADSAATVARIMEWFLFGLRGRPAVGPERGYKA